jgi:hypothetical protein
VSTNVTSPATMVFYGASPATMWCVNLTNALGSTQTWKYSAKNGLASGACVAADYS